MSKNLGRVAYEAYKQYFYLMPDARFKIESAPYERLPQTVRQHWELVAEAVVKEYEKTESTSPVLPSQR